MKFVMIAAATLAVVTAASAADIPRPLSDGATRQDADWQDSHREDPDRQAARRQAGLLIRGMDSRSG
jgi:hypothetical protein